MSSAFAPAAIKKEFRALAPAWLAGLALFVLTAVLDESWTRSLRVAVYFLGPTALGALSMGHEYNNGTLSLLLSQPRRREQVWLLKLTVMAALVLTLAVAGVLLGTRPQGQEVFVFILPLLCGLFLAPWLTMLCRSALAGIVFTLATPALVMFASEIASAMKFGAVGSTMGAGADAFKTAFLWRGMLGISAVAAVAGWRTFMRLEAIAGPGQAVRFPWLRESASAAPAFAQRRPLWLLLKKELRLQQLSFVVTSLYVLTWFGTLMLRAVLPDAQSVLLIATLLNAFAAPVLAGSLASAEERQLGTIEWHTLLPMSAGRQWWVKAGVVMGVAGVLGIGVPTLLSALTSSREITGLPVLSVTFFLVVIFLSVTSLYVSSLCASGTQALMWSAAASVALVALVSEVISRRDFGLAPGFSPTMLLGGGLWVWKEESFRVFVILVGFIALGLTTYAGGIGLFLGFARANHRSAERGGQRLFRQCLWLALALAVTLSLASVMSRMFTAELEARSRAYIASTYGNVTVTVVDAKKLPVTDYTVVAFPQDRDPRTGRVRLPYRIESGIQYGFDPRMGTHLMLRGKYEMVAVPKMERGTGVLINPELVTRLKRKAIPVAIAAGESQTLELTITPQ